MKARVVYVEPEKAKKVNDILAAEKEFHELQEKKVRNSGQRKT